MKHRRTGFTLLEILLVVAIVALLAALMLPVISLAKRSSYRATCIENLRQIGVALSLYESDSEKLPPSLDAIARSGVLLDRRIALCPIDPVRGFGSRFDACSHKTHDFAQSYETIFAWQPKMADRLKNIDPNHGVVACRLHGSHAPDFDQGMAHFCDYAWHMFEGTLLRLRMDGSVQTAKYRLHRKKVNGGLYEETALIWELFTDLPDPAGPRKGR